jgi:hypothetical protein
MLMLPTPTKTGKVVWDALLDITMEGFYIRATKQLAEV